VNKVIQSNCIDGMKTLEDEVIDLCVTSPPYDDLRSYNDSSSWNFDTFKVVAEQLYRVMKVGGVVVWVVGDATVKGSETGSSFRQCIHFMDLGFILHDTMIYEKNGSPFPARRDGNRYSQVFEYMFVLSKKTKPKTANLLCDKPNRWAGYTHFGKGTIRTKDGSLIERNIKPIPEFSPRNNIWKYNTGKNYSSKDDAAFEHPAIFPESLAKDHILTWSEENDLILDPFMGSGTTAVACIETNRKYLGFEVDPAYYDVCLRRIEQHVTIVENKKEEKNSLEHVGIEAFM
jgi:site-specific DNA-methyltransferase (adenine-specific)